MQQYVRKKFTPKIKVDQLFWNIFSACKNAEDIQILADAQWSGIERASLLVNNNIFHFQDMHNGQHNVSNVLS